MASLNDLTERLPAVETIVNYIDSAAPIGAMNDVERQKSTLRLIPFTVPIRDARPILDSLSLDRNGFVVVDRPSRVRDFHDSAEVEARYFPEIEALIRDLTGAPRVLVFGPVARDNSANPAAGAHRSVHNAHIDYDLPTIRAVADRLLTAEEKQRYAGGRIMLINVWRPIVTVESAPLALCDSATVARDDLVFGPIGGNSAARVPNPAGYNLAYNAAHRWYYVPRLRPEEALVFRLCDSDPTAMQWAAHTSFVDPTSPPDAAPRQSIEVRTLALFAN